MLTRTLLLQSVLAAALIGGAPIVGLAQQVAEEDDPRSVLWAEGVVHSGIVGNVVEEQGLERATTIDSSFEGQRGIANANLNAGVLNNQANLRAIALGAGATGAAGQGVELTLENNLVTTEGGARQNSISNSFVDSRGIVGVNQASGIATQQVNSLALSIDPRAIDATLDGALQAAVSAVVGAAGSNELAEGVFGRGFADIGVEALGDGALEELVGENTLVSDPEAPRHEQLSDSFTDFRGIAQVSQSAGDLNRVQNRISLSVLSVGTP